MIEMIFDYMNLRNYYCRKQFRSLNFIEVCMVAGLRKVSWDKMQQQSISYPFKIILIFIIVMQTNIPKNSQQPINRERPLQKSMFLPEHYPPQNVIHPIQQQPGEFTLFNPMKRSLLEGTSPNMINNQYQPRPQTNQSFSGNSYNPANQQFITLEQRSTSQHEIIHHSSSTNSLKHGMIVADRGEMSMQMFPKPFSRMQKLGVGQTKSAQKGENLSDHEQLINEIVNQIKEKHLTGLVNNVKRELLESINLISLQFSQFKEEFKGKFSKQESVNNELRNYVNQIAKQGNVVENRSSSKQKDKELSYNLSQLQKQYFLLEAKIKSIQSNINDSFAAVSEQIHKIYSKIEEKTSNKGQNSFKVSQIKSTLPPIMLQYKQFFALKKGNTQSFRRNSPEGEIMLSSCEYFVDRNGYLMDSESRYLIDNRGNQIQLDEKHLKILELHKILHR